MTTEKVFWRNAYQRECDSRVTRIDNNRVYLDATVAFAFSGGQESDDAFINGIKLAALEKEGDEIVHVFNEAPALREGDSARVEIDWTKRFALMRLHSAAHVASLLLEERIGERELIGSNVTREKARVDYVYPESLAPALAALEPVVNAFNAAGHEIKAFDDPEKPGRRVWECEAWSMPCGGTHVKNTSEIGLLRLKRKNTGAGKERMEITLV
ncbi:MAG: alanyl-tRNA editing protein [Candidatus Micrarchaeia archaeon]